MRVVERVDEPEDAFPEVPGEDDVDAEIEVVHAQTRLFEDWQRGKAYGCVGDNLHDEHLKELGREKRFSGRIVAQ